MTSQADLGTMCRVASLFSVLGHVISVGLVYPHPANDVAGLTELRTFGLTGVLVPEVTKLRHQYLEAVREADQTQCDSPTAEQLTACATCVKDACLARAQDICSTDRYFQARATIEHFASELLPTVVLPDVVDLAADQALYAYDLFVQEFHAVRRRRSSSGTESSPGTRSSPGRKASSGTRSSSFSKSCPRSRSSETRIFSGTCKSRSSFLSTTMAATTATTAVTAKPTTQTAKATSTAKEVTTPVPTPISPLPTGKRGAGEIPPFCEELADNVTSCSYFLPECPCAPVCVAYIRAVEAKKRFEHASPGFLNGYSVDLFSLDLTTFSVEDGGFTTAQIRVTLDGETYEFMAQHPALPYTPETTGPLIAEQALEEYYRRYPSRKIPLLDITS